jgi:hypothetical protein
MKKDVSKVLQKLIKEKAAVGYRSGDQKEKRHHLTSLGVPLTRQEDRHYVIDVTGVKVFAGLSTFVQLLTNDVIEQCGLGMADIMVKRRVDAVLTPELAEIGLDWIMLYARTDAGDSLPWYHKKLGHYMHLVFSALQTSRWGGLLFPQFFGMTKKEENNAPLALLFPFHLLSDDEENGYFVLLEYSEKGRFLRITIEDAGVSRLQLKHIPHRVVDNLEQQRYLNDIRGIARQIHQGILRECQNYRAEYKEIPEQQSVLFEHLQQGGLSELITIIFRWPPDIVHMVLGKKNESLSILSKMLLLLEDPDVLALLADENVVKMIEGPYHLFFDISRQGACLNISFNERRALFDLNYYLDQMPFLLDSTQIDKSPLQNVRLFLIHHITSEVLGLIKAFEEVGCSFIKTFFVKYGGIVPDDFLETLLSLPEDTFSFYGLQKIESRESIKGSYMLSRQYSSIENSKKIDQILQKEGYDFLESMRLAAGYLFFQEALKCRKENKILLLVEDGGYLAPLINRFCLENSCLGDVLLYFRVLDSIDSNLSPLIPPEEMNMSLSEWLANIFIGSVEHTRNGFDYNDEVIQTFGRLQFPVCSIAISDLKRGPEAKECSTSIINAVENILHRLGLTLSQRRALILGSRGAIASKMMTDLSFRIGPENICGVDTASPGHTENGCLEVQNLDELPKENLYQTDLVIGVIGKSIIKEDLLEEFVLYGKRHDLFFASGSTKTVEFKDLENWLHKLTTEDHPKIKGRTVKTKVTPLRDLQTGMLQGKKVTITFQDQSGQRKNIYLLGELTPINFLYYGIPREIIDQVMSQLLRISIGLVKHYRNGDRLPPRLLAVDREIDMDVNLIHPHQEHVST